MVVEWIKIFSTSEEARHKVLPNKPQLLVVRGLRICLVFRGDVWLAVSDKCTHNGESLSKGHVTAFGDIVCPWHGYRFSLKTGQCHESASDLITYPVKEEAEGLFIGL